MSNKFYSWLNRSELILPASPNGECLMTSKLGARGERTGPHLFRKPKQSRFFLFAIFLIPDITGPCEDIAPALCLSPNRTPQAISAHQYNREFCLRAACMMVRDPYLAAHDEHPYRNYCLEKQLCPPSQVKFPKRRLRICLIAL